MNITDVGHLSSDADTGEDKMLKGAKRENKSIMDIAHFYTDAFFSDCAKLNIKRPDVAGVHLHDVGMVGNELLLAAVSRIVQIHIDDLLQSGFFIFSFFQLFLQLLHPGTRY